jgi:integrase
MVPRRCTGIPVEKRSKVTFHCLRHTAASLMVAQGVPLFDVAKILGHSTLAVTMRYAHFAPEAGRAGIEKLGRALLAGTSPPAQVRPDGSGVVAEPMANYAARRTA